MKLILAALPVLIFCSATGWAMVLPNPLFTPGAVCTATSPDFQKFDYPERVARCNRNIALPEKQEVAKNYGNIPPANWPSFEFDHFIPLCAGGANDISNLWPQPINEARQKDQLENQICLGMKAGTLTQAQAIEKVHVWFQQWIEGRAASLVGEATRSQYLCISTLSPGVGSPIRITFDRTSPTAISHVLADLLENGNGNEIISSGEREIVGSLSHAKVGPLKGMLLYSIRAERDRFDLYLPNASSAVPNFVGFFKVSFESTYPQFNRLDCKQVNF